MIVAITGSSGFLGSNLRKRLKAKGHDIISIDLNHGYDVTKFNTIKTIGQFDVCIHLAAHTFVPLAYKKPHDFYSLNILGLLNILELCRKYQAKMVFASSYVYGHPKYLPIDEDHPIQGTNPYAETKIIGEKIINDFHNYFGVRAVILRPFNIYGPGQKNDFLIPRIISQFHANKIELNDPRPRRDFVFIDDVVDIFEMSIESQEIGNEVFNVGYGKSYSIEQVVEIIKSITGKIVNVNYKMAFRTGEIMDTVADISKAKRLLNWNPNTNLIEGLKKTLNE